jgi:hypothetical protein
MSNKGTLDEGKAEATSAITDPSAVSGDVIFEFVIRDEQEGEEVVVVRDAVTIPASSLVRCADTFLAGAYQYAKPGHNQFVVEVPEEVAAAWSADLAAPIVQWYTGDDAPLVLPGTAELSEFLQVQPNLMCFQIGCLHTSTHLRLLQVADWLNLTIDKPATIVMDSGMIVAANLSPLARSGNSTFLCSLAGDEQRDYARRIRGTAFLAKEESLKDAVKWLRGNFKVCLNQ